MKQVTQSFVILLIGISSLISCQASYPNKYYTDTTRVTEQIPPNEEIQNIIAPYKEQLEAKMNRIIGVFAHDMTKKTPESELGNFMCDATQESFNFMYNEKYGINDWYDFTIMNHGGIRLNYISKGPVKVETIYELMPFDNQVVSLEISGQDVLDIFDVVAQSNGAWPLSKTVNLVVNNKKVHKLLIKGEEVDPNKTYHVLTTDYIANGGSDMKPMENMTHQQSNIILRDLLIQYCDWKTSNNEEISAPITNRVAIIDEQKRDKK